MSTFNYPTVSDFKTYFARAFPFNSDPTLGVTDNDIANALNLAIVNSNSGIWPDQNTFTVAFENLAAHFLCISLRAATGGISGTYTWIETSKSVQGVSQSFAVPESIGKNPFFASLTRTNFGAMYFQMIYPYMIGVIFSVRGATQGDASGPYLGGQTFPFGGNPYGGY